MKKFFGGIIAGLLGSFLFYVLITFFIEPMRFSLSYGFPPVSGKYMSSYPDNPDWKREPVNVSQIGFIIYGDFLDPENSEHYSLIGNITSSRIISYQFRPTNTRLNDYGTGLIRLDKNGDGGEGYILFLSEESERPAPVRIIVRRVVEK